MKEQINKRAAFLSVKMAENVAFLNQEEKQIYASSIYLAIMWGKQIDRENSKLRK